MSQNTRPFLCGTTRVSGFALPSVLIAFEILLSSSAGCSSGTSQAGRATGGNVGTGSASSGGATGTGSKTDTGGGSGAGGMTTAGTDAGAAGDASIVGAPGSVDASGGGKAGSGGATGGGGSTITGGATGSSGAVGTGGTIGSGGKSGSGGAIDAGSTGETRDPRLWPFAAASIWNMPIGSSAVYVPAQIKQACPPQKLKTRSNRRQLSSGFTGGLPKIGCSERWTAPPWGHGAPGSCARTRESRLGTHESRATCLPRAVLLRCVSGDPRVVLVM